MWAPGLTVVLVMLPSLLLFYMAIEVYLRNKRSRTNQAAALFFLLLAIVMRSSMIIGLLPVQYQEIMELYLHYFSAFMLFSAMLYFTIRLKDRFGSPSRLSSYMLCGIPLIPCLLILFRAPWISVQIVYNGISRYQIPSPALHALTTGALVYSVVIGVYLIWSQIQHARRMSLYHNRQQLLILLAGTVLTAAWTIPMVYVKSFSLLMPFGITFSELSGYGSFIYALCVRLAMTKYELMPNVLRKYEALFELSPLSILLVDDDGTIKEANHEAAKLLGCELQELSGNNIRIILNRPDFDLTFKASGGYSSPAVQTFELTSQWGKKLHVSIVAKHVQTGGVSQHLIMLLDTAETKAAEEKVRQLAYFDSLTSLGNRLLFQEKLAEQIAVTKAEKSSFSLMLLDLDRFKQVNDTLGHHAGDHLLKHVADILRRNTPDDTFIARLSGDEFALIFPGVDSKELAEEISSRLFVGLSEPFVYEKKSIRIMASMGISLFPEHSPCGEELLRFADQAMYMAKGLGRHRFVVFETAFQQKSTDRQHLVSKVRHALISGEFQLYYQPQLDTKTGDLIGAEALLRWCKPGSDMVHPEEFIPLAEENGMMTEIGYWVLDTACQQQQEWTNAGLSPVRISVNLTHRQFTDPSFIEMLTDLLKRTGMDPGLLCLEMTERTLLQDEQYSMEVYRKTSDIGVKTSIDDFGTGYASLALLKHPSIESIKIDRSLIKDMMNSESSRIMIQAIISMSQCLGKNVLAEGVEDRKQWELLADMGCREVQGFYCSKPLSADEFTAWRMRSRREELASGGPESAATL
jgi:diguanylate cyclase (GGDEF)-like protein/PAS domain S-box-containing protein